MNPGLMGSGLLVLVFGLVIAIIGFDVFYILALFGLLMIVAGLFSEPREPIEPEDPSKKFCWFCLAEISKEAEVCEVCGIRQKPLTKS